MPAVVHTYLSKARIGSEMRDAEETETPGLVIVPDYCGGWTGNWMVVHQPSGSSVLHANDVVRNGIVGIDKLTLPMVRRFVEAMRTIPVDWAADVETVRAEFEQHKGAIEAARDKALRLRRSC